VPPWQAPDEIPRQPGLNGSSRPQPGLRNGSTPGVHFPGPRPVSQADQISWWDTPVRGTAAAQQQPPQPVPEQRQAQPPLPPAVPQAQGPDTNERLPIFEAVESEWFQRRGKRLSHSGWSPRAAQPWESWSSNGETATANGASNPAATGSGQHNYTQHNNTEPARYAAPPPIAEPAAPTPSWSSTGDDGWRAAEALARPTLDGVTPTGLPKRVPKANLVPGKAGGSGAARATPPPGLTTTADSVRKRLSTFRRHTQPDSGESADQS
jgi:hypothetical protein